MKNLTKLFETGEKEYDEYGHEVIVISHAIFDAARKEFESAQHSVQRMACRLGDDPIHVGPFVHTPEGRSKCTSCGEQW